MKEDIIYQAERLLKLGRKKADFVLVNVDKEISEELEVINNSISGLDYSESCSFLVTLWKDGKKGVSVANRFSEKLIDYALKAAKASKKLEYFYGLPTKAKFKVPDNFDKRIIGLDEQKMIEIAKDLISQIKTDKVSLSKGEVAKSLNMSTTLNSEGVDAAEKSTSFAVALMGVGKDKNIVSTSWKARDENQMFKYDDLVAETKAECIDFLKAKELKKDVKFVIFKPWPVCELMTSAFLNNFNAKSVEKKQSCLVGKLGEQMFDESFSLTDDGTMDKGVNSGAVDFEGTPQQKTRLISKGVVKSFVYDHNTAKHAGVKSTGNAALQGIGFTNVIVDGKFNKVDEGLIVNTLIGAHTSNSLTTDFSVKAENCYLYKNGEKLPVKGVMLSGKMLDVLSHIISIDKKKEQNSGVYTGSLVSDKVRVIR